MKKHCLFLSLFAFVSLVLAGQPCFAQEAKSMAAGMRINYVMFQDTSIDFSSVDATYDPAVAISADFSYFVTKSFSLEASIGYLKTDVDVEYPGGGEGGYATLTQIPILVTARYHLPISGIFSAYFGGGVGYYLHDMDRADGNGDFFEGAPSGVEAFADDALGIHLNAGMQMFVKNNLALNLDVKYTLLSTDMGYDYMGYESSSSADLNSFAIGLGLKYFL